MKRYLQDKEQDMGFQWISGTRSLASTKGGSISVKGAFWEGRKIPIYKIGLLTTITVNLVNSL